MAQTDRWTKATSPFHAGEQAIQSRLGMRDKMERFGRQVIRPFLPDQHRRFYGQLPFVAAGSVDDRGWPWASLLVGKPGFVSSPDAGSLFVAATPFDGDPLAGAIASGAPLGLLGIELATRRRNRVNARVSSIGAEGFGLTVDQAFGNCPQYIQTRAVDFVRDPQEPPRTAAPIDRFSTLDAAARAMIGTADTFFVASYVRTGARSQVEGVDVSHRGGRPGFVKVDGDRLTVPDYSGNFHFNTLGNFLVNPRAGLTFLDFATGDVLLLTGMVELIWEDDPEVKAFRGAERAWRFTLDHGIRLTDALPLRWTFGDYSPNTLITGDWDEAAATLAAEAKREAWRDYRVARIQDESEVIRSFHLEPADGDGLVPFKPGQYLTIRTTPEGADKPAIRTYTVSSAPSDTLYRISVKREPARDAEVPPGLVSNHLHDTLKPGDIVQAKAPRGDFTLDAAERRPAVLMAGGVGITPMICMARHMVHEGLRTRHMRPLTIFHSAQTTRQRAFFDAFRELEAVSGGAIRYFSLVDKAGEGEKAGVDYHGLGYLTADMLRQTLPLDDYDFYLCGPAPFMQAVYDMLRGLGVRDARIHAEAFGPASLQRRPDESSAPATRPEPTEEAEQAVVRFARSDVEQRWDSDGGTLLELAEAHGLRPDYGCRSGSCGSCAVKLTAGKVAYRSPPSADRGADEVLICCAVPAKGSDTVEIAL